MIKTPLLKQPHLSTLRPVYVTLVGGGRAERALKKYPHLWPHFGSGPPCLVSEALNQHRVGKNCGKNLAPLFFSIARGGGSGGGVGSPMGDPPGASIQCLIPQRPNIRQQWREFHDPSTRVRMNFGQMPISTPVDISPAYGTTRTVVRYRRFRRSGSSITSRPDGSQSHANSRSYQDTDRWAI